MRFKFIIYDKYLIDFAVGEFFKHVKQTRTFSDKKLSNEGG